MDPGKICEKNPAFIHVMRAAAVSLLFLPAFALFGDEDWQNKIAQEKPGDFPAPRPLVATYRLGWASFVAAEADVFFTKPSADEFQLKARGRTTGLVRALWRLNATTTSRARASTLLPIRVQQTEEYRANTVQTELRFNGDSMTCLRSNSRDGARRQEWKIALPEVRDMHSAMLFIRSQPLCMGESCLVAVCPGATPYLASARLVGREPVQVEAGKFKALKLELKLWRIGDHRELVPHTKFKRAFVWISDDTNRLVLRVRADIFVGSVWAELERVDYL
jgi:hypothetical protein